MKLTSIILMALVMMTIACQTQTKENSESTNQVEKPVDKPTSQKTILFFGNSITAGYQLDLTEAFPALIQERLDSLEFPYQTVNAGLSGETTASGDSRVNWVLKNPVDIFVLELGANDGLRGISTDETRKNLKSIISKVRTKYPDCKIILAGMMIPPNMGLEYSKDFQTIYPQLASELDLALIPFILDGVAGIKELNLEDGIHPTAEGHKILAENIWKVLQPLLLTK